MYPEAVPNSLLRLAEISRPDNVNTGDLNEMRSHIDIAEGLVSGWASDDLFWRQMCRNEFVMNIGQILPHVTNGQFDLAALIQSRVSVPPDAATRARKAVLEMPDILADCLRGMSSCGAMDLAGISVQILDTIFMATSGGLLMAANLVTQGYPMAIHGGIIDAGAKTILGASKRLKGHVEQLSPVIYQAGARS